jgi:hypothetical protein
MTEMPRRESVQPDRPMTPKALRELTVIARILAGAVRITLQNPASNTPTVVASLRYRRLFMEMADKLEADATELERCSLGSGSTATEDVGHEAATRLSVGPIFSSEKTALRSPA